MGWFRDFLRPYEALRQVKKQQIKVKFWILGPKLLQHDMCPNFLKNHSTLTEKPKKLEKIVIHLSSSVFSFTSTALSSWSDGLEIYKIFLIFCLIKWFFDETTKMFLAFESWVKISLEHGKGVKILVKLSI